MKKIKKWEPGSFALKITYGYVIEIKGKAKGEKNLMRVFRTKWVVNTPESNVLKYWILCSNETSDMETK